MRQPSRKQTKAKIKAYWDTAGKPKKKKPAKPRFQLVKEKEAGNG